MPPHRYETLGRTNWSLEQLNHEANILHPNSSNNMKLTNLGKITRRVTASTFPYNPGTRLVNAISPLKGVSFSGATAAAAARAKVPHQAEVRKYLGRVNAVRKNEVIAEIGPPDRQDRWKVKIPRACFAWQPQLEQEFAYKIVRFGSQSTIIVRDLSKEPLPELKDFGLDKEELLRRASQSDV